MADTHHILVVDDEKFTAHILKQKLEEKGIQVTCAYNGSEAIALLDKEHYDVILLDILMPIKSGWDVLEHMRGKNQKIIITTNLSQDEDRARATSLGALDYFVKANVSASDIIDKAVSLLS